MKTLKEAALVYRVEQWLVEQGYDTPLELKWRPLARTDLAGRRGGEYVAVEVKVRDWRGALEQAISQGMAFDRVYIAAEWKGGSPTLQQILDDDCPWTNWVGVLGVVDGRVEVLREARRKPGHASDHQRALVAFQFLASSREGQLPYEPRRPGVPHNPLAN